MDHLRGFWPELVLARVRMPRLSLSDHFFLFIPHVCCVHQVSLLMSSSLLVKSRFLLLFLVLELFRDSSHSIPLVLIVLNFTWYSPALWVILTSHCLRPPRLAKETPPLQADVRLLRQVKDEEVHQINKYGEFSKSESHYKLFFGTCTHFFGERVLAICFELYQHAVW